MAKACKHEPGIRVVHKRCPSGLPAALSRPSRECARRDAYRGTQAGYATTPYIDYIGIIVTDPDQAIEKLRPLFGDPTRIKSLREAGLRAAEFQAANVQIELLQYTEADAEFAKRVMGEQGRRGQVLH
jgi:hypothetical protein